MWIGLRRTRIVNGRDVTARDIHGTSFYAKLAILGYNTDI
jgi:hypothetical protein